MLSFIFLVYKGKAESPLSSLSLSDTMPSTWQLLFNIFQKSQASGRHQYIHFMREKTEHIESIVHGKSHTRKQNPEPSGKWKEWLPPHSTSITHTIPIRTNVSGVDSLSPWQSFPLLLPTYVSYGKTQQALNLSAKCHNLKHSLIYLLSWVSIITCPGISVWENHENIFPPSKLFL